MGLSSKNCNGKWVKLDELVPMISSDKWSVFRRLRLRARARSQYESNKDHVAYMGGHRIDFTNDTIRLGLCGSMSVNVVPVEYPQCWKTVNISLVDVFVSDDDLLKLGCIVLSGEQQ